MWKIKVWSIFLFIHMFFTQKNPIRMIVVDSCTQMFAQKLFYLLSPAGVSLNCRVWKMTLASVYWQFKFTSHCILQSCFYFYHHPLWYYACICKNVCCICTACGASTCCAHTLCAGTKLTNTVSSSSCDTVSPSQMMELIRSTMCICTFWLWPLLWK